MASSSLPRPGHNGGSITNYEHELLTHKATPDGVHGYPTDPPPIYADPSGIRTIRMRANIYATVRGSIFSSGPTDLTLEQLAPNTSGQPRIDLIVLRLNRSDYTITPAIITGVPAASPIAPSPQRNAGPTGFYDHPIGEVRVAHNATTLASNTITIRTWYLGSDGQIRCTPDSRPRHEAGRRIWEHPTGSGFISTGDEWIRTVDDADGVITPASGLTFTAARLRRRNGLVTFALTVWRPAAPFNAGTEYVLGSVPPGFRPPAPGFSNGGICPSNQSVFTYSISDAGVILMNPGTTPIATNRPLVLNTMTYPVA
ncbi:hypothetical protein ACIBTV_27205 [Micromonospora sp. NPDC049366]|uniref:hypothetical protein n=1 Tax=Micromonospora sp. NPDC049366 TaxID=3364271 RepID=UPI0037A1DDC2